MKKIILQISIIGLLSLIITNFNLFKTTNSIHQVEAQTVDDALLYSQTTTFGGTARSIGIGGAFGALGGDFSSATINPAGIGLYQKNEFVITPAYALSTSKSDYLENNTRDNFNGFYLGNAALIFSNRKRKLAESKRDYKRYLRKKRSNPNLRLRPFKRPSLLSTNYAFGINRLKNFNSNTTYSGQNNAHSITDYLAEQANGYFENELYDFQAPFDASLAYITYLVDPDPNDPLQYTAVASGGNVSQRQYVSQRRGMTEGVLSAAANLKEKFYLGGTVSIPVVNYESERIFEEENLGNPNTDFVSLRVVDNLTVQGAGINIKLGAIYRIDSLANLPLALRIGGAYHSPTAFTLTESYNSIMTSNFSNGDDFREESPAGINEYNIVTPWRGIASLAFVIYKKGFISVDYEYVDYTNNKFSFNNDGANYTAFANQLNSEVGTTLNRASNLRIGGEMLFRSLRFRLGYAHYGTPYKVGSLGSTNNFTAGVGLRYKSFYTDFALVHSRREYTSQPYTLQSSDVGTSTVLNSINNLSVSVGFRF